MKLSSIDLNLLHVLHVMLQEESVTRAAKRLGVTPPAVSNSLRRLRELLDDPLFVKRGRGLVATPRAIATRSLLAESLDGLAAVIQRETFDPASVTDTFTIALADAEQLTSLPRIAASFARALPRAHLTVASVDVLIAGGGLAGGNTDLVVGPPADESGIRHEVLFEEEGAFVVRRDHPRIGTRLGKRAFGRERHIDVHIAMGRGGRGHDAAEDAFAQLGLERSIAVTVPTFTAAAFLAAESDWVAGIPRTLADRLVRTLPIKRVRGPLPRFGMPMAMAWHERTDADPGNQLFREVVRAAYRR